jgi:hypothetical protein
LGGGLDTDTVDGEQVRSGLFDQDAELAVQIADFFGEGPIAAGEVAQRGLGALGWVGQIAGGTEPGAGLGEFGALESGQLVV